MNITNNHIAFHLMKPGFFQVMYDQIDPVLMAGVPDLKYFFYRSMYKVLEESPEKQIYAPTKDFTAEATVKLLKTDLSSTDVLRALQSGLPTKTGIVIAREYAFCYALFENMLYVSLQGNSDKRSSKGEKQFGVAGFICLDLTTGEIHIPPIVEKDETLLAFMIMGFYTVLYMGLKPDQHVETLQRNSRYKTRSGERFKNRTKLPVIILDKSYKKTYHIPPAEIQPYTRWQWYGPKNDPEKRFKKQIVVKGFRRGEYTRSRRVKG